MAWMLWRVPTERGKADFGWEEKPLWNEPIEDLEEAEETKYLDWCDDRAPDKWEYYKLELRETEAA